MKLTSKITLALAVAAASTVASASDNWTNSSGQVWRNTTGLCWQNNFWTPATAAAECGAVQEVTADKITLSADAFFNFDKAVLKPAGEEVLTKLAAQLKNLKLESAIATGYTDSVGSEAYNLALSERRAKAVKAFLVAQGVPADQIVTIGKGEADPAASNATAEGRAKNRRVVLDIVASK
ncbi:outer membrane protein OmpA [Basilea psittacipulmonis]|uniref:Membrane protein n=1 Tax=Basilea psittacipulmonis DSM 24701 TaxID=1072685 RepID=A0A077DFI2_9BURK|nr:OmpA family protein [Basilea psittacipulmonis]AIL32921.1 membrane protein [Basilea psittacipulmonis DSM 24701]